MTTTDVDKQTDATLASPGALCACARLPVGALASESAQVFIWVHASTRVWFYFSLSLFFGAHVHLWHSQETGDDRRQYTYISLPHTATSFPPSRSPPLSDSKSRGGDILFLSVLPDLTIFIFLYFHLLHLSFHRFYSCHIGLLQTSLSRSLSHYVLFFSSLSVSLFLSVANLLLAPGLLPAFTFCGLCVCLCCLCMCRCVRSVWQRSRCRTLSAATLFHQHRTFRANYIMLWLCVRVCDTKRSPAHSFIVPVLYCVCKDSHTSASSYSCLYSLSNHIVYTAVFKTVFMKLFDR